MLLSLELIYYLGMKMKFIFVIPEEIQNSNTFDDFDKMFYPAYGPNILATILKNNGIDALVLDSFYHSLSNINQNENLTFNDRLLKICLETSADIIVGFSVYSNNRFQCYKYAKILKEEATKYNKNITIIFGGPHPTAVPDAFWKSKSKRSYIDYIVLGETEDEILPLVRNIFNGYKYESKNIINLNDLFFDKTKSAVFSNLDSLPIVDYSKYLKISPNKMNIAPLLISRGCSYGKCKFCFTASNLFSERNKKHFRVRNLNQCIDEIDYLVNTCGVNIIRIWDDNFFSIKKYAKSILNHIKKNYDIKLILESRFDTLDEELLILFKDAGGFVVYLGLESGSEKIRKNMAKGLTNGLIIEKSNLLKSLCISFCVNIMLGYLGETDDDIDATKDILNRIKPDGVLCSITRAWPNTPLFFELVNSGLADLSFWVNDTKKELFCVDEKRIKKLKILQKTLNKPFFIE